MSTGQETFQPSPTDQTTQQTDPNLTASAAQGEGAPQVVDVDDADLNAALAEAQAEETGATSQTNGEAPAPAAQQQPATREQPAQTPMIPKQRFDEALGRAEKAERDAAYLRGQLDARTAPAPAAAAQQILPPTPDQQLAAIGTATEDLAKRFDDGEITMAEFKREERVLQQRENTIRDATRVQPAAAAPAEGELYLETLTAQLEQQHPWVMVFDQVASQSDWDFLKNRARDNLIERGVDVSKKSAVATFELRKEVSRLADELGPSLVGERAKAKGIQLPGTQASQQQQQPPKTTLSPAAQARQAALAKAAGAPPDVTAMNGYTGAEGGLPTDANLEAMNEEDIAKLPTAVRNKLLGISP